MKLLRYGPKGAEKPGLLDAAGQIRDLSGVVGDIAGDVLTDAGLGRLMDLDPEGLPLVPGNPRIGPCVGSVGKILCIGLNYSDHAEETGNPIPEHPIVFSKATSAISGPNDDIVIPKDASTTDWEVELGVVIGEEARNVPLDHAMDHVAGYCVANDVSERDFQLNYTGQWTKGKSSDSFGPFGPWLVTKDEVADPGNLKLWCEVDGERRQDGTTRTMIFNVAEIISHLSRFMSLQPGDLIMTGTPPGVGMGMKPQVYLKPGQVVKTGIEGMGEMEQRVAAYSG